MRFSSAGVICAATLLAAMLPGPRALADDSDLPGVNRRTTAFQRPMRENPGMAPYLRAPAPVPAGPASPPAPGPVLNVLHDADSLILHAETEIRAHDLRQADLDLEQAAMSLQNARAAGDGVPAQAIGTLERARSALHHGRMPALEHEAEAARHIIASAE